MEILGRYSHQEQVLRKLSRLQNLPAHEREVVPERVRQLQRHLSEAEQRQVVKAYLAGSSTYTIGRQLDINRQTVAAILERHDVRRRNKPLSKEQIEEGAHLYESGKSLQAIADQFEVGITTVRVALLKAGVTMRTRGGARAR